MDKKDSKTNKLFKVRSRKPIRYNGVRIKWSAKDN